jgi:Poly(R)-hydroxyalkanoic acid synthase subunit (PHA_synth_III_E)
MPGQNGSTNTAADPATPDVAQMWRAWLTETERQLNSFFGEVVGTEQFARFSGNFVDGYAVVQRALNQNMERYLNTFNLPTHSDIVELAERLNGIEERLSSLETTVRAVAESAGVATAASVTQLRPRRTRKPRA